MKLTKDGIGWLIFGVLMAWSCTEADGILATLSTIALGGVFILIYVIRQFFKPDGIGWYICGGTLLAFCIESGYNSDTFIALILGAICLYVFYMKNKDDIDDMFSGASYGYTTDPLDDFSYVDPDTYTEPSGDETTVVEVVEETTDTDAEQSIATDVALEPESSGTHLSSKAADQTATSCAESDAIIEFDIAKEE